jgi:hypothetical protein
MRIRFGLAVLVLVILLVLGMLGGISALVLNNSNQSSLANRTAVAVLATNTAVQNQIYATGTAKVFKSAPGDQKIAFQPTPQRLVIKNASVTLVVDDPNTAIASISQMAEKLGGWVIDSKTSKITVRSGIETTQGSINIRIPAQHFTEALAAVKTDVLSVNSENITGEDVTDAYSDLASQVANLEAAETQLRTIMNAAQNTQDVLAVYDKLVNIRGQIDKSKGTMQLYQQSAAYSSISVTLLTNVPDKPVETQVIGWNAQSVMVQALAALISIIQFILGLLIWLVIVGLPLLLIVGLPSWILFRILRRWNNEPVPAKQTSED